MHKIIVFLLLATSTLTYGGCPSQEEHTTHPMQCKDLLTYLKSSDNPVKIANFCRFTYKNGTTYDLSQIIYAIITHDHVQIFKAEDKELLDK
jgi:hypothetical protein